MSHKASADTLGRQQEIKQGLSKQVPSERLSEFRYCLYLMASMFGAPIIQDAPWEPLGQAWPLGGGLVA